MINNPCRCCKNRHIGCHTTCDLYKNFIKKRHEIKQKIQEERTKEYMFERDNLRRAGKMKEEKK